MRYAWRSASAVAVNFVQRYLQNTSLALSCHCSLSRVPSFTDGGDVLHTAGHVLPARMYLRLRNSKYKSVPVFCVPEGDTKLRPVSDFADTHVRFLQTRTPGGYTGIEIVDLLLRATKKQMNKLRTQQVEPWKG